MPVRLFIYRKPTCRRSEFDGGETWTPAVRQALLKAADEHFKSYWTPIPAGVDRVLIRGADGWFGPWMVRDISIWAP